VECGVTVPEDFVVDSKAICLSVQHLAHERHVGEVLGSIGDAEIRQVPNDWIRQQEAVSRQELIVPQNHPSRVETSHDRGILSDSTQFHSIVN
jgi:hypothetical protein